MKTKRTMKKKKECIITKFFKTKKNLPMIGIGGLILAFAVYALAAPSAFKGIADNMFGSTMQLRSQNTVTTSHTYDRVEIECVSDWYHEQTASCSSEMNEVDRAIESLEECKYVWWVETIHFDIDDRCETQWEFNCTDDEVLDAAEEFESDFYGFMDWIDDYMDECDLESNHYDWIEVECENGEEIDIDYTNADCDEYEEWLVKARDYCEENDSYVNNFEMEGHNCGGNNIDPLLQKMEALRTIRRR